MRDDEGAEFLQYRLAIEPRAARRARHVISSVLDGWQLRGLADDVVGCVSELVANVFEHAAKSATADLLIYWVPGRCLTVEVRDQDPRMPRRRKAGELTAFPNDVIGTEADDWPIMQLAGAGRGLVLVDALCDQLTWHPHSGGGKAVRCRWWLRTTTDTHVEPRSFDLLEG